MIHGAECQPSVPGLSIPRVTKRGDLLKLARRWGRREAAISKGLTLKAAEISECGNRAESAHTEDDCPWEEAVIVLEMVSPEVGQLSAQDK